MSFSSHWWHFCTKFLWLNKSNKFTRNTWKNSQKTRTSSKTWEKFFKTKFISKAVKEKGGSHQSNKSKKSSPFSNFTKKSARFIAKIERSKKSQLKSLKRFYWALKKLMDWKKSNTNFCLLNTWITKGWNQL